MNESIKIIDAIIMEENEVLYIIKYGKEVSINIGDIFSDCKGNKFEVISKSIITRLLTEEDKQGSICNGVKFKNKNGVELTGEIMKKHNVGKKVFFTN